MSERREQWATVGRLIGSDRPRVVLLAVTSTLGGVAEAAFLVVITRTGLSIAQGGDGLDVTRGVHVSTTGALAIALALVTARLLLTMEAVHISTVLGMNASRRIRKSLSDAYLRASWVVQQEESSGRLQQLLTSFTTGAIGVIQSFTGSIASALSLAALVAVAIFVDPVASGAVVLALAGLGLVLAPLRRRVKLRSKTAAASSMTFGNAVAELGALGLEMHAFGAQGAFAERIDELSWQEARRRRNADWLRAVVVPVYSTIAYVALLAGLGVAALIGSNELGSVGAVMLVMLRSLAYGQQLQQAGANLAGALPFVDTIEATMARYRDAPSPGGDVRLERTGRVTADAVSFAYDGRTDVLHDLTFAIEAGECIGVVGPSGSGKTTLVHLLLGLRVPTRGVISADGVDLRRVDRSRWTELVSFVPQDPLLFSGTVAENIAFFRPLSVDQVTEAAERAHLLTEIEDMPEGMDTQVGERGSRLSGGQRQRLAIARALAGRTELLILDEPTSSLDVRSETMIRATLAELRGEVTIVIIAHRLTTLDTCDRIMVVQGGELLAFDRQEVLARESSFFREALQLSGLK